MAGAMMRADPRHAGPAKPLVVYSGPFRIEFKQFATVRDFNAAAGTASAQFEVIWEPRLRPMLLAVKNEDLAIADDQGRPSPRRSRRRPTRPRSGPATAPRR